MNQMEMNRIAMHFIEGQSAEVAAKLRDVLYDDVEERAKKIGGPALHYIHNIALFYCLVSLNNLFLIENESDEALKQYLKRAETLRPQFLDIVESLKDFRPTEENRNKTKNNT